MKGNADETGLHKRDNRDSVHHNSRISPYLGSLLVHPLMPNKDSIARAAYNRLYYQDNLDKIKADKRLLYEKNREKALLESKKRYAKSKGSDSLKEYRRSYFKDRRSSDVDFRIRCNLRTRLHMAAKNGKSGSAIKDMGCTVGELRAHLEARFAPGMTWDNYGTWHIDHIKPLAKFDLNDHMQLLEACNYKNLQPLWAKENQSKGIRDQY